MITLSVTRIVAERVQMTGSAAMMTNTAPEAIGRARDTLVKALYLKRMKHLLRSDPDMVISQLEEIRHAICQISHIRVLVIANIEKLKRPVSSWEELTAGQDTGKALAPIDRRLARLSNAGKHPGDLAYIIPMPIDSSFAYMMAKGPAELQDPRVPALMVAISYLDAVEGPLWTAVRGTGLAYGTYFSRAINSGHVTYTIFRSPDAFKAFAASKEVLNRFILGETSFDTLALEGAISSIVLEFANGQSTMTAAAQESFVRQVIRDLPNDWNDVILKKVRTVDVEQIKQAMKDILLPVLTPESANLFITCAAVMQEVSDSYRPCFSPLQMLGRS